MVASNSAATTGSAVPEKFQSITRNIPNLPIVATRRELAGYRATLGWTARTREGFKSLSHLFAALCGHLGAEFSGRAGDATGSAETSSARWTVGARSEAIE